VLTGPYYHHDRPHGQTKGACIPNLHKNAPITFLYDMISDTCPKGNLPGKTLRLPILLGYRVPARHLRAQLRSVLYWCFTVWIRTCALPSEENAAAQFMFTSRHRLRIQLSQSAGVWSTVSPGKSIPHCSKCSPINIFGVACIAHYPSFRYFPSELWDSTNN